MKKLTKKLIDKIVKDYENGDINCHDIIREYDFSYEDVEKLNEVIDFGMHEDCPLISAYFDVNDFSKDTAFCMEHKDDIYWAAFEYHASAQGWYSDTHETEYPGTVAYEGTVGNVIEKYRDYIDSDELAEEFIGNGLEQYDHDEWVKIIDAEKYRNSGRKSKADARFKNEMDKYKYMFNNLEEAKEEEVCDTIAILIFQAQMAFGVKHMDEFEKYCGNDQKFMEEIIGVDENTKIDVAGLKLVEFLEANRD